MPDKTYREAATVELITPEYLGPKADLNDLVENSQTQLNLLSEKQVKLLHEKMDGLADGRYSKEQLRSLGINIPYGVIKSGNQLHAVYKGYQKGHTIGEGGYGSTKLMMDVDTGKWSILKIIELETKNLSPGRQATIVALAKKEAEALKVAGQFKFHLGFQSKTKGSEILIGMELGPGDELYKVVSKTVVDKDGIEKPNKRFNPYLSALQNLMIGKNILKSVKDLHVKGMRHRDLKPENFIVHSGSGQVTLIDYGFSDLIADLAKSINILGTPGYMAPEILATPRGQVVPYTEQTEVYALGMVLGDVFGLTHYKNPADYNSYEIVSKTNSQFKKNDRLPKDPQTRKEILDLLQKMTDKDPAKRPSINEAYSTLNKLLAKEFNSELKVAVVDVNAFANLSDSDRSVYLSNLAAKMKMEGINAVVLADTVTNRSTKEYYDLIQQFQTLGIVNIAPQIITAPQDQLLSAGEEYFQNNFMAKTRVFSATPTELKEEKNLQAKQQMQASPAEKKSKWHVPKLAIPKFISPSKATKTQPASKTNQGPQQAPWQPAVPRTSSFFGEPNKKNGITKQQLADAINYLNRVGQETSDDKPKLGVKALQQLDSNYRITKIEPINGGKQYEVTARSSADGVEPVKVVVSANKVAEFAKKQTDFHHLVKPVR